MDMLLYEVSTPEVGKVYEVVHTRKGTFRVRMTYVRPDWASGIIVEGVADAIIPDNIRYSGEEVAMHRALCTFYEER